MAIQILEPRDGIGASRRRPEPPKRTMLTAAAARFTQRVERSAVKQRTTVGQPWQADAWEAYELVGELRFLAHALAGKVGQARMFAGEVPDDTRDDPTPLDAGPVVDAFAALVAAPGWEDAIVRLAENLEVVGEGWLCGIPRYLLPAELRSDLGDPDTPDPDDIAAGRGDLVLWNDLADDEDVPAKELGAGLDPADLDWFCLSVTELSTSEDGTARLQLPGMGQAEIVSVPTTDIILTRIWEPHPERAWEAGPATRSALPTLRTLTALAMRDGADLDSRLAGAGILFAPQSAMRSMQLNSGTTFNDTDSPEIADQFTDMLIQAASTAIQDRSSAASLVPIVLPVPDESIPLFRHLSFAQPLDPEGTAKQAHQIRRFATQMDSPPELLLGTEGASHWSAWLVAEDTVRSHIEPKVALICRAIMDRIIAPMLRAQGMAWDEIRAYAIWYDVEHLIVRPNRSGDALELHNRGVIGDDAVRGELGFDQDDAAGGEDPAVRLVADMLRKEPNLAVDPGVPALLQAIQDLMAAGGSAGGGESGDRPTGLAPETSQDPAPAMTEPR